MLKNKKISGGTTGTVIGEGVTLETVKLKGEGSVRIDGQLYGDIDLDGNLILGEKGLVDGNVKVKYALLAGHVEGNINCETTLHIAGTALINGTVEARSLVMDEGAIFNGTCHMSGDTIDLAKHKRLELETVN